MRDTFMLNYECSVQEGRRKEDLDAALARYNEMFMPGSKKILLLVDSDYVKRLEAEYLQLYRECTEGSGPDCDAIKGRMARESLERIKAGEQG